MKHVLALLAAAALASAGAAEAHRGSGGAGYVSTFSAVRPPLLGLSVNVLGGDDRLRVSNYSGKTVVILGYEREPYLRFAGRGVFVNTRSRAAYLNRFRFPPPRAPGAGATAAPMWRRARHGVTFEWHDHRIHRTAKEPPRAVAEDPGHPHLIFRWSVPGRADGKPFALTGFLGYVPPRQDGESGRSWIVPAAAGVGAAAIGLVLVGAGARRRKGRAP